MSVPRVTHHSLFSTILLFLSFHFNVDYFEILFYNSYFACVLTPCVFLPSFPLWERGQKLKLMVLARRIWFYLVLLSLASFIACLFLYFFFSSCEHAFLFLTLNIPQKGLFEFLILWVNILAFYPFHYQPSGKNNLHFLTTCPFIFWPSCSSAFATWLHLNDSF